MGRGGLSGKKHLPHLLMIWLLFDGPTWWKEDTSFASCPLMPHASYGTCIPPTHKINKMFLKSNYVITEFHYMFLKKKKKARQWWSTEQVTTQNIYVYIKTPHACGVEKALDLLELKLLAVMNHPRYWTKHRSSVKAVSVIIHCATSAAPSYILLKKWRSLNHVQPMEDVQADGKVSGNHTGREEKEAWWLGLTRRAVL